MGNKILDNKYKVGQRVWFARLEIVTCKRCDKCGNVSSDYGNTHIPDESVVIGIDGYDRFAKCLEYVLEDTERESRYVLETELFLTKADAQARCDELNGKDDK